MNQSVDCSLDATAAAAAAAAYRTTYTCTVLLIVCHTTPPASGTDVESKIRDEPPAVEEAVVVDLWL